MKRPPRRTEIFAALASIVLAALVLCPPATGQASDANVDSDAVRDLRALIPASGTVEVVLERTDPPEVQAIGYDFQSGWWYEFRVGVGMYYNGGKGPHYVYGSDANRALLRLADHDNYIERFVLPSAWVHRALRTPGCIRSIVRMSDSSYLMRVWVSFGDPVAPSGGAGTGGDSEFLCTVSADGRTIQISPSGGGETFQTSVIGHVGPGLPVRAVGSGGWRLASSRFVENSVPEMVFSESHVQAVVQRAREREAEMKRAGLTGQRADAPQGPNSITFANAFEPAPGARWGRGLVVAGGLLIAIGAWLWWKHRR